MFWYITSITEVTCGHTLFVLMSIHEAFFMLPSRHLPSQS